MDVSSDDTASVLFRVLRLTLAHVHVQTCTVQLRASVSLCMLVLCSEPPETTDVDVTVFIG